MARRSNRKLTQEACNAIAACLDNPRGFRGWYAGNTSVTFSAVKFDKMVIDVSLFGRVIAEISEDGILVRNGGFFDSRGFPSRTTRERLNGILDLLGYRKLIPDGVRVFISEDGCKVGKGHRAKPLDKDHPSVAVLFDRELVDVR